MGPKDGVVAALLQPVAFATGIDVDAAAVVGELVSRALRGCTGELARVSREMLFFFFLMLETIMSSSAISIASISSCLSLTWCECVFMCVCV